MSEQRVERIKHRQKKAREDIARWGDKYIVGMITLDDIDYLLSLLDGKAPTISERCDVSVTGKHRIDAPYCKDCGREFSLIAAASVGKEAGEQRAEFVYVNPVCDSCGRTDGLHNAPCQTPNAIAQRRAEVELIDAAIVWHESGQIGGSNDWLDAGERLSSAITSLLAFQLPPATTSPVPVAEPEERQVRIHEVFEDCCMCNAPRSFMISPFDPAVGYCFTEGRAWRITATKGTESNA